MKNEVNISVNDENTPNNSNFKSRMNRKSDPENIKLSLLLLEEKQDDISICQAAKEFNVCAKTLSNKLKKIHTGKYKENVFSEDDEEKIVEWIIECCERGKVR